MKITVRQQIKTKQVKHLPEESRKSLKLLLGSENIFICVGIRNTNKMFSD
jgi:hypothetical protein